MSDWRETAARRAKERTQGSTIKLAEGDNCLRLMPDKKDIGPDGKPSPKGFQNFPFREIRVHRDVGPDKKFGITCGYSVEGEGACWLCDVKIPELEAMGSAGKRALAQAMAPQDQLVINASRFDADTRRFTPPKTWWISTNAIAAWILGKFKLGKKDLIDPNKGYNINISRTGTGLHTRYPDKEIDESPSKVPPTVLTQVKDLDSIVKPYDEEDQKAAYYGHDREESSDEEKPAKTKRPAPVEEATEPDEETEEVAEDAEEDAETVEVEDEDGEEAVDDEEVEEVEEDLPEEDLPEEVEEEEVVPPPPPKKKPVAMPAKKPVPPAKKTARK